jgi:hypothetical protein
MYSPVSFSRNGLPAARPASSPTTSRCRPSVSSYPKHSSCAASRRSSHAAAADSTHRPVSPARAGPRHSASADRTNPTASAVLPPEAASSAAATPASNPRASTAHSSTASRYPPATVRITSSAPAPPSACLSLDTAFLTCLPAVAGGSSQTTSTSRRTGTTRPASSTNAARTLRSQRPPSGTSLPPDSASTPPRIRNSIAVHPLANDPDPTTRNPDKTHWRKLSVPQCTGPSAHWSGLAKRSPRMRRPWPGRRT